VNTIIIEPGTPVPAQYATAVVDEFSFSANLLGDTVRCPTCHKFEVEHTWQVTEHGRVVDCSEAVAR
jgi:hypothetical protein